MITYYIDDTSLDLTRWLRNCCWESQSACFVTTHPHIDEMLMKKGHLTSHVKAYHKTHTSMQVRLLKQNSKLNGIQNNDAWGIRSSPSKPSCLRPPVTDPQDPSTELSNPPPLNVASIKSCPISNRIPSGFVMFSSESEYQMVSAKRTEKKSKRGTNTTHRPLQGEGRRARPSLCRRG